MVFMRRRGRIDSGTYKIRLYRYGVLWKTIKVTKGSSVKVGACDTAYSDDTFYGWSTEYNSVTSTYTSASSITPTSDINLYAVFSYVINEQVMQTRTENITLQNSPQTLTISGASIGGNYDVYTTVRAPYSVSTPIYSNGVSVGASYSVSYNSTTTYQIQKATITNSAISYTFDAFSSSSQMMYVGTASQTSTPTATMVSTSASGYISYQVTVTQTDTKYRVVSHDNLSVINVYRYGVLYKTYSMQEGLSITVGSCAAIYDDDTFYGYSINSTSTARNYTDTSAITPHGVLDLYAVYSYIEVVVGTKKVTDDTTMTTSPQTVTLSATAEVSGTATLNSLYSLSTPGG